MSRAFLPALTFVLSLVLAVGGGMAGAQSLLTGQNFGRSAESLFQANLPAEANILGDKTSAGGPGSGSLFAGRQGASLFAPMPLPLATPKAGQGMGVTALRSLIAGAEAGRAGYDAVQHGARIKPGKLPTDMTIGEIYTWIRKTPGQPHAIGRYQFIPKTLRALVDELGLPEATRFSPDVQDALADLLLEDAGFAAFKDGRMTQTAFMNNLAKIWAGLPNSSGKSHYHGYAGNKATMSWTHFQSEMSRIFPRG